MLLTCYKNGSLARDAVRKRAGLDWDGFAKVVGDSPRGNDAHIVMPFFIPEITPLILQPPPAPVDAIAEADRGKECRGVLEAQAMNMRSFGVDPAHPPSQIRVTGGASANVAVLQVFADVLNAKLQPITSSSNAAALGGALRAANAAGVDWDTLFGRCVEPFLGAATAPSAGSEAIYTDVLAKYHEALKSFGLEAKP